MRAWLLNFDADDELARGRTYGGPPPPTQRRFTDLVMRATGLVPEGDARIGSEDSCGDGGAVARAPSGAAGYAFCPTPWAIEALKRAGARPPLAPSFELLRRVNDRGFAARLGYVLPGGAFVERAEEIASACARAAEAAADGQVLLKRAHGFAGRGRRKVNGKALSPEDVAWCAASFRRGGLLVEPFARVTLDAALHGFVARSGAVTLGAVTIQTCEPSGAWRSTALASDDALSGDERERVHEAARTAAEALVRAGYFGPFGIDAFRYDAGRGQSAFHALCDLNARYTMGFGVGMQGRRVDLTAWECAASC
jgi:hypothetical protein